MNKKIFIVVALLFIFPLYADCGWKDVVEKLNTMPYSMVVLPPETKEVKQEKKQMMGNEFTITLCNSKLPFTEIAKFYRERLAREGWEDISTNAKVQDLAKTGFFTQTLIFRKTDDMINIQNLPSANLNETVFSLSRGNTRSLKSGVPELEEVEFKDLPVYPNATVVPLSSIRSAAKEQLGYTTADKAGKVIQFYREKLPIAGWTIQSELPLSDYGGAQSLGNCPGCEKLPAEALEKIKKSSMKMSALNIIKQGKSCYIGATEIGSMDGSEAETIISVSCNK